MKTYFVYITTNKNNNTLYTGVTSSLVKRIQQHKEGRVISFTKKYNLNKLVYFEQMSDIRSAIQREKELKKWSRRWKIELIEKDNPSWEDLFKNLF